MKKRKKLDFSALALYPKTEEGRKLGEALAHNLNRNVKRDIERRKKAGIKPPSQR